MRARPLTAGSPLRWLALLLLLPAASALGAGPGVDCAGLLRQDFRALPDALTTLGAAREVAATADLPAHCQVQGFVAPQVRFDLRLPEAGLWNGKFLMQGCGGLCGELEPATCDDALARHYAVVVTDMGHQAQPWQAAWAFNNLAAEVDFAYRATHVVAVAAKAITTARYGRAPSRAYFRGCSTGGRQGLVSAQRFPADFDGIIAGAPVLSETGVAALHLMWSGQANLDGLGRPILSAAKLAWVHRLVLAACDGRDGRNDGIIADPEACNWQPEDHRCPAVASGEECLTGPEVAVMRRLYDGARNSAGEILFEGGLARGSEYEWVPNFIGKDGPALFAPGGPIQDLYRYLIFLPDPGPQSDARFNFDTDPPRLGLMESLYTAMNPDLSAFRKRGGRLLIYQGWDDIEVPPRLVTGYYARLEQAMGGRGPTRDFARLYMLPGVAHCRRGPGADTVDWLTVLERWVEQGEAPEAVTAYHLAREQNYRGLPRPRFPLDPADFDRTVRIRPYAPAGR